MYFRFSVVRRLVPVGLPVYEIDPKIQLTSSLQKSYFARCIKVQLYMTKIISTKKPITITAILPLL